GDEGRGDPGPSTRNLCVNNFALNECESFRLQIWSHWVEAARVAECALVAMPAVRLRVAAGGKTHRGHLLAKTAIRRLPGTGRSLGTSEGTARKTPVPWTPPRAPL
ncbi:hypothetical protein TraAM80_10360, partial [Trypanosoma rangeli]